MTEDTHENPANTRMSDNARPPVVWTPEDAANFLSAAIKESQRPLAAALKKQGVPYWVFGIVLVVMLATSIMCWLYLDQLLQRALHNNSQQAAKLQNTHSRLEAVLTGRNQSLDVLNRKYAAAMEAQVKAQGELERLKGQLERIDARAEFSREQVRSLKAKLEQERQSFQDRMKMLQSNYEKALLRASRESGNQKELRKKFDHLTRENAVDKQKLASMQKELATVRGKIGLLRKQVAGLQQERDALRTQLDAAQALLKNLQPGTKAEKAKAEESKGGK